jgi:hypothetical protein
MKVALLLLLAVALSAGSLRAAQHVWVALYVGENRGAGPQASPAMTERLREVFGFTHYRLLRGENVDLAEIDRWVLWRKDFFLRVRQIPHAPGEPARLRYEIYKDGFLIADGAYLVNEATPLFINGPDFNRGRLIFVLQAH